MSTIYSWIGGKPVITNEEYEWVGGKPFIIITDETEEQPIDVDISFVLDMNGVIRRVYS